LSERVEKLERRLDDTEDDVWAALAPDRLDDLWVRVDDLAAGTATHEELVELRLHVSRVATELARVTTELRGALEQAARGSGATADPAAGEWVASA